MSVIHYAIEIDTGTATTNTAIGLQSGIFRFITGRPGYSGAGPTYPTNEDDSNNTYRWYEDFIADGGIGGTGRSIDIVQGGNYGTLSEFSFSLRNDNSFWNELTSNEIFLVNKNVSLFLVINDVFYSQWSGVVTLTDYDEKQFKVHCNDSFLKIHSSIPPEVVNNTTYPNATENSQGKSIPVCFGEVPYAKTVNVEGSAEPIPMMEAGGTAYYSACAISYWEDEIGTGIRFKIDDTTKLYENFDFTSSGAGKYYVRAVSGSDSDSSYLSEIVGFTVLGSDPIFTLQSSIPGLILSIPDAYYSADPSLDTWYFQIVRLTTNHIVSNFPIEGFQIGDFGAPRLFEYNDRKYKDVSHMSKDSAADDSPVSLSIANTDLSIDGEMSILSYHTPKSVQWAPEGDSFLYAPELIDRDRSTFVRHSFPTRSLDAIVNTIILVVEIPKSVIDSDISSLGIFVDFTTVLNVARPEHIIGVREAKALDVYQHAIDNNMYNGAYDVGLGVNFASARTYALDAGETAVYNAIPDEYYDNGGNDLGQTSDFSKKYATSYPVNDLMITSEYLDSVRNGYSSPFVEVSVATEGYRAPLGVSGGIDFDIRQVAFLSLRKVDVIDGSLYARVDGELVGGVQTYDVYRAFQHMLETYDGISSANIDYGNVPSTRTVDQRWYVGRQITERKNSSEYLRELCRTSFVGMVPKRNGDRKLSSWIDDATSIFTFDETNITKGAIKKFLRTNLADLFNVFNVKYSWSPGHDKYDKEFVVAKLEEDSFPDATTDTNGDGVYDWMSYFSGLDSTSWVDAQNVWNQAKQVYDRTGTTKQAPKSLTELPWFIDRRVFDSGETVGIGTDSSAFKYLKNLVDWTSRQKAITEFSIPVSSPTIGLELLDRVEFSDKRYTLGENFGAWIVGIKLEPATNSFIFKLMIEPGALDQLALGDIVETGSQTDTITESGSQIDTITEG